MLFIVSTPIGNMEDMTLRAIRILREADFVVAEDTRRTGLLLKKFEIATPMLSFHSHSPSGQFDRIMQMLKDGKNLGVVSDAGTPGISDPGYMLIRGAIENGIKITSIPGPSAVITALTLSGLPSHRFLYLGYLPLKKGRKAMIQSLKGFPHTVVIYEAPHRIIKTLSELFAALGNRPVAVCREMTKIFEEIVRGTLQEAVAHFTSHKPKGEFTVVVGPE